MTDLEDLRFYVEQYFAGRLPKYITVHIRRQRKTAYGDFRRWPDENPFRDPDPLPPSSIASGHEESIELHTLETDKGKVRAGYGPQGKSLILIEVVGGEGYRDLTPSP